ncbi:UDP-2,4-diacetamido-2,4,6-trideoxy-beta-L-altropyranose hydrolase [Vampirovibrio chlorellavorus]|uniref:UDP-2,4-diacetamido-2,4, 6-trideoxy-beta-L-altropyranose hydrolase n=1 Tax=Vampirovibrio chlorellavorus TaxID=758823 RepID=UPI0026E98F54|nr:UDP-2,4-diacetamido-2,4,6-trideoxy-beta-L-altropyranose hydrolase [Vampirovibrio chlorellavorus]
MKVLFRADASVATGTGHVVRCLTLAQRLAQAGMAITFACRHLPGDMNRWIAEQGFALLTWEDNDPAASPPRLLQYLRQTRPDWVVVDHYQLDAAWEGSLRDGVGKILVIDDLADRPHHCDVLLDQNYFTRPQDRYQGLIPPTAQCLLGPRFALLRPEFSATRAELLASGRRQQAALKRIQVCFGGSDPTGETLNVLEALSGLSLPGCIVDVIVGASNPAREDIEARCQNQPGWHFHCQTPHMARLMAEADLAIGAGGTTTWERLCLGLPAIVIAVADNQRQISQEVADAGAQLYLGTTGTISPEQIAQTVLTFARNPALLKSYTDNGLRLVDGGGTHRILEILTSY